MNPQTLFNVAKTFPIVKKRKLFKNLLLYPTALLTALSLTFSIQEKTNSVDDDIEINYQLEVCNEYKKIIYVARAKSESYLIAGDRNYGSPYGRRITASKVRGWIPVSPNKCKIFSTLSLGLERPKYSRYLGRESSLYIKSSDNKSFPPQHITSYRNSQGGNTTKPSFCVTDKGFNFSSKGHQLSGYQCPRNKPEGAYFVIFEPVYSSKNKIVFR
ncbi:hypothetical protein [Okeania sp.]|uniref:hypothetical protein n=1 Tax=Okeania sp. TaxID=3100323 RepID=UPI002B4B111E|nr:hypothetical protein [Okeania sp.]MEB3341110.1 hypothetical protein [Okeania sp.]